MTRQLGLAVVLLAASFVAAVLLQFDGRVPEAMRAQLPLGLAVTTLVTLAGLAWTRVHRKVFDFVSLRDFMGLLKGMAVACLVLVIANQLAPESMTIPWSVLTAYFGLASLAMSIVLFNMRLWRESPLGHARRSDLPSGRRPLLVYGAGRAGSTVAREVQESPEMGYELAGFLDDDPSKWGRRSTGFRCSGTPRPAALHRSGVARRRAGDPVARGRRREILSMCRRAGAHVRIVPGSAGAAARGQLRAPDPTSASRT
jgi:FlaA1/EpsC-like NDP-sugar epimerase